MSRREPGPGRQGRHARDRLQATLGGQPGLSLLDGGAGREPFQYGGAVDGPGSHGREASSPRELPSGERAEPSGRPNPVHARLRWRVGLRVALLLAGLALGAAGWFWSQAAAGRPEVLPLSDVASEEPVGDRLGAGASRDLPENAGAAGQTPEEPAGRVVVHVAGAVAKPGVVQLPAGSRVHQAITAAGGAVPAADLDRLNLALVLADGQKIQVPREGEPLHPGESGGGHAAGPESMEGINAGGTDGPKVNLNAATLEELDTLPKVGPVLAQRILDWRKDHGSFKSVEELDAVDGVGPKMLEALLPLVTV